jgi:hypothetical protein
VKSWDHVIIINDRHKFAYKSYRTIPKLNNPENKQPCPALW